MADAYSQTISGEVSTTVSDNARKSVDSTTFGTRDLVFLQIRVSEDLETDYTNSNSYFFKLVQTLQQSIEIYGVGIPNGQELTVVANRQSVPYSGSEANNAGGQVSVLRTLINAHPDLSNAEVYHGKVDGWSIQNDC